MASDITSSLPHWSSEKNNAPLVKFTILIQKANEMNDEIHGNFDHNLEDSKENNCEKLKVEKSHLL